MKKTIIISGASGNIGKAVSNLFYQKNYPLHLLYHSNTQALERFNCAKYQGSLTDQGFINETVNSIGELSDFVNINCAGITDDKLIPRLSEHDFMNVIDINLKGIFFFIQRLLKKNPDNGHIINLASISGVQGRAGQTAYAASKGGLISLTRSLAVECGKHNIRANIVLPGFIPSPITEKLKDEQINKIQDNHVLKRFQTADEAANFIFHLALMENVSGQIFNLDSRIVS